MWFLGAQHARACKSQGVDGINSLDLPCKERLGSPDTSHDMTREALGPNTMRIRPWQWQRITEMTNLQPRRLHIAKKKAEEINNGHCATSVTTFHPGPHFWCLRRRVPKS